MKKNSEENLEARVITFEGPMLKKKWVKAVCEMGKRFEYDRNKREEERAAAWREAQQRPRKTPYSIISMQSEMSY